MSQLLVLNNLITNNLINMSRHVPVLSDEVVESLKLKSKMNVVDCTLGDAGHAELILNKIKPEGRLLGIDADPESVLRAKQYLYGFGERATFVRDNFINLKKIVAEVGLQPVNAILLDLGWSTPQFEERGRGFSFEKDEVLDMRYSGGQSDSGSKTAGQVLNESSFLELKKIFKLYGEEKFSESIAQEIIEARKIKPLEKTGELVKIVLKVYREKLHSDKEVPWIGGIHPATKVFQALRIETNNELKVLQEVLPQALDVLAPGGRLAVITFHSLEDRIVKHYFQKQSLVVEIITKKPIVAGEKELEVNAKARSAKLRVVEKLEIRN